MADGRRRFAQHSGNMTGDFLPRRRQASILSQALTIVIVLAVVGLAVYLFS